MEDLYKTDRLILKAMDTSDHEFIYTLVNTPGWLTYIGDRQIHSAEAAIPYIQKIMDNPLVQYWVVSLKSDHTPIGIITFIKRDYLYTEDLGFAFLPAYTSKGYAYESAQCILKECFVHGFKTLLATTIKENQNSIRLLNKLGFKFSKEIMVDEELLWLFEISE